MAQGWDNQWDSGADWNSQQQPQQDYSGYGQQYSHYGQQHQQAPANSPPSDPYGGEYVFGNLPGGASQFMADPMFKAAQQFGGQFAEQQKDKLVKYLNPFKLKYYFSVDNTYVGKKIGLILFPFFHTEWTPRFGGSEGVAVPAREDVNAPDLYIPLMAFLTYVLVSGFVLGTQSRFSPEILGILTSNALVLSFIENIIIYVAKYVMNISASLSIWHSLAYSTYKFVGMTLCLAAFMSGGVSAYYATLAYTSLALVFFLLRTVANFFFDVSHYGAEGRKRKLILILFILVTQPFIMWWLTSGVTSFNYEAFELARKTVVKMPALQGKGTVPMTVDDEVDYEALLKLPKE